MLTAFEGTHRHRDSLPASIWTNTMQPGPGLFLSSAAGRHRLDQQEATQTQTRQSAFLLSGRSHQTCHEPAHGVSAGEPALSAHFSAVMRWTSSLLNVCAATRASSAARSASAALRCCCFAASSAPRSAIFRCSVALCACSSKTARAWRTHAATVNVFPFITGSGRKIGIRISPGYDVAVSSQGEEGKSSVALCCGKARSTRLQVLQQRVELAAIVCMLVAPRCRLHQRRRFARQRVDGGAQALTLLRKRCKKR